MSIKYNGKYLKDKKHDGSILKDIPEGEMLKDKKRGGQPLWKNSGTINESEYSKKNLNE